MATLATGKTWVSGDEVTPAGLNNMVNNATISGIVNADIASAADIAGTKLADAAVSPEKLATGAVTGAAGGGKLAASAITGQTPLTDALATGDEFLVHDASAAALRRVDWSSLQPAGTVLKTEYDDLSGIQTYTSGHTLSAATTSPTVANGVEILSINGFATSSASNYLIINVEAHIASSNSGISVLIMLFAGSTLIATMGTYMGSDTEKLTLLCKHSPGSTASVNYTVRAACESGNLLVNRNRTATDYNTGKQVSSMLIQEIKG